MVYDILRAAGVICADPAGGAYPYAKQRGDLMIWKIGVQFRVGVSI
jgi:hypothetical protein